MVASTQTQIHLAEGSLRKTDGEQSLPVWMLVNRALKLEYECTPEALAECIRLAEEALALDPGSGRAHFALGAGLFHLVWMGYAENSPRMLARCRKAADDAIRIDRDNEYAHWLAGMVWLLEGDHDRALASMRRALEVNPNCSQAHGSLATLLNYSGAPERAVQANQIAIRSNPRDPSIFFRYSGLAISHFLLGDLEQAIEWARRSVHLKPSWYQANVILIAALVEAQRVQEAEAALSDYLANCEGASLAQVQALPFRHPEHLARIVEALRAVNGPDHPRPISHTGSAGSDTALSSGG